MKEEQAKKIGKILGRCTTSLTQLFIVLKLTNVIDWSWVWILSPQWFLFGIFLLGFLLTILGHAITNR